jgi:hypothetical protein
MSLRPVVKLAVIRIRIIIELGGIPKIYVQRRYTAICHLLPLKCIVSVTISEIIMLCRRNVG